MAPVNLTSINTTTTTSTTTPLPYFSSGRLGQDYLDYYPYNSYNYKKRSCWLKLSGSGERSSYEDIARFLNCINGYSYFDTRPSRFEYDTNYDTSYPYGSYSYNSFNKGFSTSSTTESQKRTNTTDEYLKFIATRILLPIVMVLIAICFVLGVILIIKSYKMAPLKQNLATAVRRRRRVGHAPDNQYVPPAEMHASNRFSISDRKSLPPPAVLQAARERASQIMSA